MQPPDAATRPSERRNTIASLFLGILSALACQEMVASVRESVRGSGITAGTAMLFLSFLLTSIRFFSGMVLHLVSPGFARVPGRVWFYDFTVFIVETVVLIFMGGLCSVEANATARYGFLRLLVVLLLIDIGRVCSQGLLAKLFSSWPRPLIAWAWAGLNAILVLAMVIPASAGAALRSLRRWCSSAC